MIRMTLISELFLNKEVPFLLSQAFSWYKWGNILDVVFFLALGISCLAFVQLVKIVERSIARGVIAQTMKMHELLNKNCDQWHPCSVT